MAVSVKYRRELDTGSSVSLDTTISTLLNDSDLGLTATLGLIYAHVYDATSTASASTPDVIVPVDNPTEGRWILQNSPFDPNIIKPGTFTFRATETVDDGYLECTGAEISRTTYSVLYAEIGVMYGEGDGSTTFNLPDFRGLFPRGWDHGAGVDPDAADRTDRGDGTTGDYVGTKQECELQEHSHQAGAPINTGLTGGDLYVRTGGTVMWADTYDTGGNETRPVNINVMICIKY